MTTTSVMLGWDTNRKSKSAMVGLTQKALKDGYIKIRSQAVLSEMAAYRRVLKMSPDGNDGHAKMSAPAGKNDDACVALMIANAVAHYCPGSGADVRKEEARAASSDHNKWSSEDWDAYENWTRKAKSRLLMKGR